jgi:transposase
VVDIRFEALSRDQLLVLVKAQAQEIAQVRAVNEQLRERIEALEAKRGGPSSGATVPDFVKPARKKAESHGARKRRAQAFVRHREEPTRQVVHACERCRECGTSLFGGSVKRTRQVLHVPIVPVEVIEHVYIERCCPVCGKRNVPKVDLGAEVVAKSRLSSDTMAMIASWREVGRMTLRAIQWQLENFHGLHLSVGQIVRVLGTVANRAKPLVDKLREQLRASRLVHADETGWREDGQNGYIWSFSNESLRYFLCHRGRGSEVVREVLGDDFSGVLVSDFYSAYNFLDCPHQRCWVHLLRDVHELTERHPDDEALADWAGKLHELYLEAKAWQDTGKDLSRHERVSARLTFEERLLGLATPYLSVEVPQRVLCQRIDRFLPELMTFVELPWVPSDNNAAERAIRPQVVARKISGGTRSPQGSTTKAALATIFATWQLKGLNPFLACRQLLNSP